MAQTAVARQLLHDLRRKIAAIEGVLPERFDDPSGSRPNDMAKDGDMSFSSYPAGDGIVLLRQNGRPADIAATTGNTRLPQPANHNASASDVIATGVADFDQVLGGGLTKAALCELHGAEARDTGAVSGFTLALASIARRQQTGKPRHAAGGKAPLLWIGASDLIAETGFPHMPGIATSFDLPHEALLFARTDKPLDALWIAGEAAGLSALGAVIIEIRGNPQCLDLTATRRLHRRACAAGRPVFLLRLSADKQPTAAPVRLCVSAAPARPREIFGEPLKRSLGASAFTVRIDKCRTNPGRQFILEWNSDEYYLCARQSENSVALVPASSNRQDYAAPFRPVVALRSRRSRKTG